MTLPVDPLSLPVLHGRFCPVCGMELERKRRVCLGEAYDTVESILFCPGCRWHRVMGQAAIEPLEGRRRNSV